MAKVNRTKKTTRKSPPAKKASARSSPKKAGKKTAAKPSATRKTTAKKTTTKKTAAKKATSAKPTAKKKTAKKSAPKAASKKTGSKKAVSKKTAKKSTAKQAQAAAPKKPKKTTKKAASTKAASQSTASKAAAGGKKTEAAKPAEGKGSGRKGITIVSDRKKKTRSKPARKPFVTPGGSLLGPGVVRKPLIPSGPNATSPEAFKSIDPNAPKKTPFNKRELTKFKNLLLIKRAELRGDIEQMEADALRSNSGDLSHLPQHLADQGSDSYEQSLSLDLAAADRRMLKEIDDALARIDKKTYGICERTGKPIRKTRLNELPWARYSIEAAREMERRGGF